MVLDIEISDMLSIAQTLGIIGTLLITLFLSRRQVRDLSIDIETKVLSDLDEKITGLTQLMVEKPQLMKIFSNVESKNTEEMAFTYHLLQTFAHVYHMHQRKVVSDNEWTGWLRRMRTVFEEGKIREYWEGGLELEKWFDPAFEDFINNEIVRKTSPKQKM